MEATGPSSTSLVFDGQMELGGPQLLGPVLKLGVAQEIKGSQARLKRLVEDGG